MPRIFDNIDETLLPAIQEGISLSYRADFCVGYFNLRGWRAIADYTDRWEGGENNCCRLLIGMQSKPKEELLEAVGLAKHKIGMDNTTAVRQKRMAAEDFREQLASGVPTSCDEIALRRLAAQLKAGKVVVKLFLRHSLHAKLYLLFRDDPINPVVGYLGSSNLTFSGLKKQGELNIDVLDGDACNKLAGWFEDRWNDRWCLDISEELAEIIENSWARIEPIPPYYIYLKIAYHLSHEARVGISEFAIPGDFGDKLMDFQKAAVKIAAHHLNKRGGVLIGDVVGLGKTLMATAVARIMEDDHGLETLIICPKNLVSMWEDYSQQYRLRAKVLSLSRVSLELPTLRRFRIVLIDESHNLRNREGKRFRAIQEYIRENESKCILLSATPYNKDYLDLSNQLRLFVKEDRDLGIRPERLLREIGETEFIRRHQCPVRSLAAFEKSTYTDDWRELMRLYLVRRTRSFIQDNYARTDASTGRRFLTFEDGSRSYFPTREPRTIKYHFADGEDVDQYARLYSPGVVDTINELTLPRYGLGNYIVSSPLQSPTSTEAKTIQNLSRAGKRLMGFCRTNLFKRLESSGMAFMQSIERHILRNYVYLYAIENILDLPIGTQDAGILDSWIFDEDSDSAVGTFGFSSEYDDNNDWNSENGNFQSLRTEEDFKNCASIIYREYVQKYKNRFKWLRTDLFVPSLAKDLKSDAQALHRVIIDAGEWRYDQDKKLEMLVDLLTKKHPDRKVIIFTQFADTVRYLEYHLKERGIDKLVGVTGEASDPASIAWRFSPVSSGKRHTVSPQDELRVLITTDVLSEGQNLQDCSIVVNFDLPWAIIRLIQRVGRVDRIGQKSEKILCYSFLPADGVERIIRLRLRIRLRLKENAEVLGTDEEFFEEERHDRLVLDIYNEMAGILDSDADSEVDLASYAYQVWKNAVSENPRLEKIITELQPVVYSTRPIRGTENIPEGVLVYLRTAQDNDALVWMDKNGKSITESQKIILDTAKCSPDTPALTRLENHHELVGKGVELMLREEKNFGGQLGRPSGARFRAYERLKDYALKIKSTLFEHPDLNKAIDDIYHHPLRQAAVDTLNRQLRSGISDEELARLVIALREEDRLCIIHPEGQSKEPRIICSLGLTSKKE